MQEILNISPSVSIPLSELEFSRSRSGGPGGQHVNKVETSVTLRFNVADSPFLTKKQKGQIASKLSGRMDKHGSLSITARDTRSQKANKDKAIERFVELMRHALKKPKFRVKTRPSRAAKARRLDAKKKRGAVKRMRKRPTDE